ncbi:unnamed protein product [Diamesa tonsa]
MSQKLTKLSPKNTMFNYFKPSPSAKPSTPKTPKVEVADEKEEEVKTSIKKSKRLALGDDSSDEEVVKPEKKRRTIIESDDEEENVDNNKIKPSKAAKRRISDDIEEETKTPAKIPSNKTSKTPNVKVEKTIPKSATTFIADAGENEIFDEKTVVWAHEKLDFIKPENIRDINRNKPGHPNYDARTLHVPDTYLQTCTPALHQWWKLKAKYYDCVFFFKVGKFYEFYHMDAMIGVKELGFTFMKGEFAHSGFPEKAYDKMATALVEKGYKVARIEQTENPEMMQERCRREKTTGKFAKVMNREICQITNVGTQVFSSGQQTMLSSFDPNYMMAITEKVLGPTSSRYGVCFIDTTLGNFTLGEFDDDQQCSRLLTLLSHYTPVLVLFPKNELSVNTTKIVKNLPTALKESLLNGTQFWDATKTLKYLSENVYSNQTDWPKVLQEMKEDERTATADSMLALKALGGSLWYLSHNLLEKQVLSIATFVHYTPPDSADTEIVKSSREKGQKNMILDNITLNNLSVFGKENSLFTSIDYCATKFGKRLLMEWLCSPSCIAEEIKGRQEAVNELYLNNELLQNCRHLFSTLPDLERHLAQVHSFGNKELMKDHPNARAILYESHFYGKKKISDFADTINGLESLMKIPDMFSSCSSKMLVFLTQTEKPGSFIDMTKQLQFFKSSFNFEDALKTGYIIPEAGVDEDYDGILKKIEQLQKETKSYLKEQEVYFRCKITYSEAERTRFQLIVPSKAKKPSGDYHLEGTRKGKDPANLYHTDESKEFLKQMIRLETEKKVVQTDIARKIFEKFSKDFTKYKHICTLVAKLDVIAAFAEYARNQNTICTPEVHEMGETSFMKLKNGIHPLVNADDFIPNGITIPNGEAYFELITGPNMGGKSTLMREIALLSIMAQIGCPVPAESLSMSLIDRIFTRLGANDNIMAGQSTFLVELDETAAILKHCTKNSLILLDELGRGTSTYDGTAIAGAVANFLADLKCRTLFSTHYHSLVDNFFGDPRINLGHMACMVENENCVDITQENVTFLYKYASGACSKSYGFNAAKLAGIKLEIIRRAHQISKKVEAEALKRKIASKMLQNVGAVEIGNLIKKLQFCYV